MSVVRIAVTGEMGAGKSSVSLFLKDALGGDYLDCDNICRQILEPGEEGRLALKSIVSAEVFAGNQLNRPLFRSMIFADHALRQQVNNLLHPLVRKRINSILKDREAGVRRLVAVIEVPLLFEAGWQGDFDRVVVVRAGRRNCIERISARDDVAASNAALSYDSQMSIEEKARLADDVVDNDGTWEQTCVQLKRVCRDITVGMALDQAD